MAVTPAFRIDCGTLSELSAFVAAFRREGLRVLMRRLTLTVADDAARRIDLHVSGVDVRPADDSPVRDALAGVRASFEAAGDAPPAELDFDCEVRVFLMGPVALVRFEYGGNDYLRTLAATPGARRYDWSPAMRRPDGVPEAEWRERAALWAEAEADAQPRLGSGLVMRLAEGRLPAPKWPQVAKLSPPYDLRVRRTAKALAWQRRSGTKVPSNAKEATDFRRWLATDDGAHAYDGARRQAEATLHEAIGRDRLMTYGRVRTTRERTASVTEGVRPVDHADVYEAVDGAVFVVVWECGLGASDRVYVQISDRQVTFTQAGRHFGTVENAPHLALDILSGARDATLVEMRRFGDRVEVKAKHVAIVRNTSMSDTLGTTMTRWRSAASKAPPPKIVQETT